MKLIIKKGTINNILHIFIQDSSKSDGSGLTGLAYDSPGLTAYYIKRGESVTTAITLASAIVGSYLSGGFIEVDATNMPGIYELDPPDDCFTSADPKFDHVVIFLKGAANMAPLPIEIQLVDNTEKDIYDRIGDAGANLTDLGGMSTGMKAEVNSECDTALSDYDPPTRAEATSDKDAIIDEVNANETKIDAIPSNTDTQLSGTHGSGSWEGVSGADWTANEKKQIRDALGVDGDKTDVADSRIVDDIKKHDNKITGLLM